MAVYGSKNGIVSPLHPLHLQEAVQVQGLRPVGDAEGSKATVWIATMGLQREVRTRG